MKKWFKSLIILFVMLLIPMESTEAATNYHFEVELYKFTIAEGVNAATNGNNFLKDYQKGSAVKISDTDQLNPGDTIAVGFKVTPGSPADATSFSVGLLYDTTLLDLYLLPNGKPVGIFDRRPTSEGGIMPDDPNYMDPTDWKADPSTSSTYDEDNNLDEVVMKMRGSDPFGSYPLTDAGIFGFLFFTVKDDAPANASIVFDFNRDEGVHGTTDGSTFRDGSYTAKTFTVYGEASSDGSLKTLTATGSGNTYTPDGFTAGSSETTHNIIVPNGVSSIDLQATANDGGATVLPGDLGSKTLNVGNNSYTISVTAADGSTTVHTVNIRRLSNNADLDSLSLTGITLAPDFGANTITYNMTVPYNTTSTTVSATVVDTENATLTGDGNWNLSVGSGNTRQVVVTPENCKTEYQSVVGNTCTTKTYTLNITRSNPSSDKTLKDIKIDGNLIAGFAPGTKNYPLAPVKNNITSLNVTATPNDANATAVVKDNTNLQVGNNTITITVTAEDGTTDDYTLTVYRQSNDAGITLNVTSTPQGTLTNSGNTYTYEYDEAVTTINVNGTTTNANVQSVTGLRAYTVASENQATVVVTAEDGTVATYTVNFTRKQSNDNTLFSLSVEKDGTTYDLSPDFAPGTTGYTVNVPKDVDQVEIKATATSPNIKGMTGTGTVSLNYGDNPKTVVVTAENNSQKTYNINIKRALNDDATLQDIKVNNTSITGFAPNTPYTLDPIKGNVNSLTVVGTPTDSNASAVVTGNTNLQVGNNTITITVTAQDGVATETYTLNVYKQSNDAGITLSVTSTPQGTLTPNGTNTYDYEYDEAVTTINVNGTTSNANVQSVTGLKDYTVASENQATVVVTAEDGTVATYTVNFNRKLSNDNTLSSLSVEKDGTTYDLNKDFEPGTIGYTVSVPNDIDEVEIKATATSPNIKGMTGTGTVSLNYGENTKTVVVTAENNVSKTYTLTITRELSDDTTLTDIKVDNTTITDFASGTDKYTLPAVSNSTTTLNISYTKAHDAQKVEIKNNNLVAGQNNVVTIEVTAQNGDKDSYELTVYRKLNDNSLANLNVTSTPQGTLTKDDDTTYTYKYDRTVTTINVNGTGGTGATVEGNGDYTIGVDTEATLTVTSEDDQDKTYTVKFEQILDTDNSLTSLQVSKDSVPYTLTPAGDKKYTLTVPNDVESVVIAATPSTYATIVSGTGTKTLGYGSNSVEIIVEAENGDRATYEITITRTINTDASLTDLRVDGVPIAGFAPSTTRYTLAPVDNSKTSIEITATGASGTTVTGQTGTQNLVPGDNTFTVSVTSQDGKTTIPYTINVRRKTDNDYLRTLTVSVGTLVFDKDTNDYTINVPATTNQVIINATKEEPAATLEIGTDTLTEVNTFTLSPVNKTNTVTLKVTSEAGGTPNIYTVTINKDDSSDTTLKNIKIDGTELPNFSNGNKDYDLDAVDGDVTSINITADPTDGNATVTVSDNANNLQFGDNEIIVTVTAEDGSTGSYKVNVYRKSNDAGINFNVTSTPQGTLTKDDDTTYTYKYDEKVGTIAVGGTATSDKVQTVQGLRTYTIGTDQSATVTVTAEDGTQETYTINFEREISSDSTLASLSVEKNGTTYPLNTDFEPGTPSYTVTVPNDIDEVEIKATATSPNAKGITGTGNVTLNVGENTVTVTVTAEDDSYTDYTIVITRDGSTEKEQITSSVYTVSDDYVEGVKPEQSITDFKDSLDNDNAKLIIYEKDGTTEFTGEAVGTGMIVRLVVNNEVLDEKIIIVTGDTTGDGVVDLLDAVRATNHYTGKTILEDEYYIAGNVVVDDVVDLLDAVKITNHYTGKALIG